MAGSASDLLCLEGAISLALGRVLEDWEGFVGCRFQVTDMLWDLLYGSKGGSMGLRARV